jgi:aryl-alcohol dehydrogenase-like predicted oxidoreductase
VAFAAAVRPVADGLGATVAELVIAWTIRQPGITFVLCGARNPAQARENARAGAIKLGDTELAAIDTAAARHLAGIHA